MTTVPTDITRPTRRFVIVVRADPVICGHSGEARCLAEVALTRGFDDVRIVTWPLELLRAAKLPMKPEGHILPYSPGITVERPRGVGDYRVPDGRNLAGMTGRLVELFTDGVPTVAMSLYLSPHTIAVSDAQRVAHQTGLRADVTTIAEAVGSDITNVVRACVAEGRFGAAAQVLSAYLDSDHCVAVSEFTKELIISSAEQIDTLRGTTFAERCARRISISYPAVDSSAYLHLDPRETTAVLRNRGLAPGGYALFLSRLARAKGVDDLIAGYAASRSKDRIRLVIVGRGPQEEEFRTIAANSGVADRITFINDLDDHEKPHVMAQSSAFVLPSRPEPEFVETFGIALVESMLAGGGPVITCPTGGIVEAVGDTAMLVRTNDPAAITAALDEIVCDWSDAQRAELRGRARTHAMRFDRTQVFDRLFDGLPRPYTGQKSYA